MQFTSVCTDPEHYTFDVSAESPTMLQLPVVCRGCGRLTFSPLAPVAKNDTLAALSAQPIDHKKDHHAPIKTYRLVVGSGSKTLPVR
jgi:hypothetical protein